MKLTHFSQDPFAFDPLRKYSDDAAIGKPNGLWLSDERETQDGWSEWCKQNEFGVERLNHRTEFLCDISNWVVISNYVGIEGFNRTYGCEAEWSRVLGATEINWKKVRKEFSGILISPYLHSCRLNPAYFWYYGWDCASACVWDLSTIKWVRYLK